MNRHAVGRMMRPLTLTVLVGGGLTGCVGQSIFGIPLGPRGGGGLEIDKVITPTVAGGGCVFDTGAAALLFGRMELDEGTPRRYSAVVAVRSLLEDNSPATTRNQATQPNYGGRFGSANSNDVQIVSTKVRYEFPTLSPVSRLLQDLPKDGIVFQSTTVAGGAVRTNGLAGVATVLLDPEFSTRIAADPDFKDVLARHGSVPVLMRLSVEGRTSGGGRVFSDEMVFRVEAVPAGTLRRCATLAATCVAPNTLTVNPQCFSQVQDFPDCTCTAP